MFDVTNLTQVIIIFWSIRTIKFVLFWIYLWQLKEYHIGRFMDHFRTHKGRKIFLNWVWFSKFGLLLLLFLNIDIALYAILLVYLAESAMFLFNLAKNKIKLPHFTFKAILLTGLVVLAMAGLLYASNNYIRATLYFALVLLAYDILLPVTASVIVLVIQPLFFFGRMRILAKARQKIATHDHLIVIGITGSYGKTSTKEFLTTILSTKFNVLSTPNHKNSEMGIAQTILEDLKPEHKVFVVEMGAYQKGGIKLLCDMVKPDIGIVTGVNEQHLATFGSLENLLSAEGGRELVQCLPSNGLIVINGDNPHCLDLYKNIYKYRGRGLRKMAYTLKKDRIDSDIWTEDIIVKPESLSFIARTHQKDMMHFNVRVLGKQQIQNLLGAILVAKTLGVSDQQIQEACRKIEPGHGGMTTTSGTGGINIIDSSYSSNKDGVMADLDYLHVFGGKKVIVMPCLIELGAASKEIHRQIGKKIAKVCDLAIITTQDRFQDLKTAALEGGMKAEQIILCDKTEQILTHVKTLCKDGDAVLLEGRVSKELINALHDK